MSSSSRIFSAALCVAALASCGGGGGGEASPASFALERPANYVLRWSDEFDGVALGAAWTRDLGLGLENGGTVWGNNEQQYYTSDAANLQVEGGLLSIQPRPISENVGLRFDPQVSQYALMATSARIKTDTEVFYSALNGKPYGFYEIRAKMPCVAGAWPAVWMMGRNGAWPERGEIDIAEWLGRYFTGLPNQVQSGVHTAKNAGANSFYAKQTLAGLCGNFQTFQLHWLPTALVIGVNGVITYSYQKPVGAGVDTWPFDQQAFLLLNVAVGGNLGGAVREVDIPSMTLQVDWVRVWQPPL